MFGFFVGTVCLIALFVVLKRGRRWGHGGRCGHGYGGWHGHHGHHGWGPPGAHEGDERPRPGGRWSRYGLRWLFERLDTTPGQEKVISEAAEEVFTAVRAARGEVGDTRKDLGRAVAADDLDLDAIGSAWARQDEKLATVREAVTGALAKVHDALDERQRKELARILGEGGFRGFGPYRA